MRLLIAATAGLALIGVSLGLRRFRLLAAGLAVIVVAPFAPALDLLLVEAFPTSYAQSTTGFSVDSIAQGETLFVEHCSVCHDRREGTGGPVDLMAPHIWGHLDGELFWRVTNGITDPKGAALMPAFGSVLSDSDVWALIDFIHARNVGVQARTTGKWLPPVPAPATPLDCDGSEADSLADLGHVLLVVADGAPAHADPARIGPESISGSARIGPENIPGAETIRLASTAAAVPEEGACVTAAPGAWEAWRVLSGVTPDRFGGYQAIVDSRGWLRAWLPPGSSREQVLAAVRDARDHPIAIRAGATGGHHH